jgi:cyclic pyranopterin phosphate synthase
VNELSHLDEAGRIRTVDVGGKPITSRRATAEAVVVVGPDIMAAIRDDKTPKGNVLQTARLAGIMAAKRTSELIPLCHIVPLDHISVDFELGENRVRIKATVAANSATGVEMEALTAAAVAALTVYDMLKALSHSITIETVRLLTKSGGKSGDFRASAQADHLGS